MRLQQQRRTTSAHYSPRCLLIFGFIAACVVGTIVFLRNIRFFDFSLVRQSKHLYTLPSGGNNVLFSPIIPGEFYRKKPQVSEHEIEEFFRYDEDTLRHPPFSTWKSAWSCHGPRQPPLVFLHLPRSAGSSVRTLLHGYSAYCGASFATVVNCLDVGYSWIKTNRTAWVNAVGSAAEGYKCALEFLLPAPTSNSSKDDTAATKGISQPSPVTWNALRGVNVLVGQIPVGLPGNPDFKKALYLTLFRDPLQQWVSRLALFEELETVEQVLHHAQGVLLAPQNQTGNTYYFPSSSVFITPYQKEFVLSREIPWSAERRYRLSVQNLQTYPVVVGVLERWPETLKLFRSVLDADNDVPKLFQFVQKQHTKEGGKSNLTALVLHKIQTDPTLLAAARHYLRYEQQLYEYAYRLHEKQYQWLGQQEGLP